MKNLIIILFSLVIVSCGDAGIHLTKSSELRIEKISNLPKNEALKFILHSFHFYNLKYINKDFIMPAGMTTCRFNLNNIDFPTSITGQVEYVSVNYQTTNLQAYIGPGFYHRKNIGKIRVLTIRGVAAESYLVNCAIKLRERDNLKKVGTALYALGVIPKYEYSLSITDQYSLDNN